MRVCWKALLCYGCIFWILLCITDFLGFTNVQKYGKELDELYEKPVVVQTIEKHLDSHLNKFQYRGVKLGWSLIVWNTVTFVFSIFICSIARTLVWICWGIYNSYRNKKICSTLNSPNPYAKSSGSLSRIPVMVKPLGRLSETNIPNAQTPSKLDIEKSCPNLLMKRSGSNLSNTTDTTSKTCRTIFRKEVYLCESPGLSTEQRLELQCNKLRDELHRLQTTSLKEHAILSRKLDSVNKDRKELSKQLAVAQKENRAAKQQLEELLQEKTALLKRLENATKEFKCNTKTKKFALARLEEVTSNVEELRQQLEQVSRDKEILEKKLKLLETEYNKLHERYIASQQKLLNNDNMPERDVDGDKNKICYLKRFGYDESENNIPKVVQNTVNVLASMSQTELDMKKIQDKIKQLEKNLENLNLHSSNDLECSRSLDQLESELSLSGLDNTTDSQHRLDGDSRTTFSEFSSGNSPRQRYWSDRVLELIGKNKQQFAKIQSLATKMQEKARFLGNIRERVESVQDIVTTDSEEAEPKRLVSSSVAFKNFLKSLNKLDVAKREIPTKPEVYF